MNFEDIYTTDLINKKKETVKGEDALRGKLILFYFSAHWCPPCRSFTPVLAKFHAKTVETGKPVAIVFVTSDRDEASFLDYFTQHHGDYYALPFSAQEIIKGLKAKYGVSGIPSLVVVKANGDVIDGSGRGSVTEACEMGCVDDWVSKM